MDYFDREVNILLMLKYLFKQWKLILLAIVLSALIGLGFGYYKYKSTLKAAQGHSGVSDAAVEDLYNSLSEDEQGRVDYIVKLNSKLNEMEDYIHNGSMMKLNPYRIPSDYSFYDVVLEQGAFKSDLEKISYTNQLRDAYENYIKNGKLVSDLLEIYPDKTAEEDMFIEMVDLIFNPEPVGNASFYVEVKEMEDFPDLDKNVNQLLQNYSKELNQKIVEHNLALVTTSKKMVMSEDILDLQEKIRSRYDNTRNAIRLMKTNGELTEDVIRCYENMIGEDGYHLTTETKIEDTSSRIKFILKYALVVLAGGLVLVIALLCFYYLVFVFGKHIISTDDYAFLKLNYLGDMTDEIQLAGIVSKIQKYCHRNSIDSVTLVSTDMSMISNDLLAELMHELKKRNIEATLFNEKTKEGKNDSYIDQLLSMDNCLFVEKVDSTEIDKLYGIVKLCNDNEIGIAGVVNG